MNLKTVFIIAINAPRANASNSFWRGRVGESSLIRKCYFGCKYISKDVELTILAALISNHFKVSKLFTRFLANEAVCPRGYMSTRLYCYAITGIDT